MTSINEQLVHILKSYLSLLIFRDMEPSRIEDDGWFQNFVKASASAYYHMFMMEERGDAYKEHDRVIRTDWWDQMDSVIHDLSGEFKSSWSAQFHMCRGI